MKLEYDEEEYYPVFELAVPKGRWPEHEIEVPADLFQRYNSVMAEFWSVQKEIREIVEKPLVNRLDDNVRLTGSGKEQQ